MHRWIALTLLGLVLADPGTCLAQQRGARTPEKRPAPTRLYPEPAASFLLLRLGGDRAHFLYTPGSLDRAANLQERMEIVARTFERWTKKQHVDLAVFVLNRRDWEDAGINVEYGIPVRIGTRAIAAPARGDAGTVALWSGLLAGRLPSVIGTPILGTPEELASLVVADVFVQVQAGEILVDFLALYGDEPWVRGVIAHLAALAVVLRVGTDRPEDLEALYRQFLIRHPPKTFSLRDYQPELSLEDWLYFQAQFHFAARAIFDKEGKDAVKKMQLWKKKGGNAISADRLRRKYKDLDAWLTENFSVVSMRR